MVHVPSKGWFAYLVHPDSNRNIRIEPLSDPRFPPVVNDLPRIYIPVELDTFWQDLKTGGAEPDLFVYHDGQRLPIEKLERVDVIEGGGQKFNVLIGIGGVELRTLVQQEYGRGTPVDDAAESLVSGNTTYATDFDEPTTTAFNNQEIQKLETRADYLRARAGPVPDDVPLEFKSNGDIDLLQSGWFFDAAIPQSSNGSVFVTTTDHSDTGAERLEQTGDWLEYEFTPDYRIPPAFGVPGRIGGVRYGFRYQPEDGSEVPEVTVTISGDDGSSQTLNEFTGDWTGLNAGEWGWRTRQNTEWEALSPDVTYTIRIEVTAASGNSKYVDFDAVWVGDGLYSYTFDNTVASSGDPLSGPEEYPDEQTLAFLDAETLHGVTRVDSVAITIDDTTGSQAIEVSGDGGATWDKDSNTATHSGVTFGSTEVSAKVRLTFSRYGSGAGTSPSTGFNGQTVSDITVQADLEDLAFVMREQYDDQLRDILSELADRADSVWEVTVQNDNITIAWTQKGGRSASEVPPVTKYDYAITTDRLVEKAIVEGHARRVQEESFTSDHGTVVELGHENLVPTREEVYSADTGEVFVKEQDYTMNYQDGEITVLSGGQMGDSASYRIDYEWKIRGEYDSGVADPRTERFDIPELTTIRGCRQAAYILVEEFNVPAEPAKVTIPVDEPGWSVIESINFDEIPGNSELHIKKSEVEPGKVVVTLDKREADPQDAVRDIRQRLRGVSRKV